MNASGKCGFCRLPSPRIQGNFIEIRFVPVKAPLRAHGFFLIGSPDETEADILQSFRFADRLKLGYGRLQPAVCLPRHAAVAGVVERGIIDDERDWYKWFKCSDIDPAVLPGEVVNRALQKGYILLLAYRIFLRPVQTFKLLLRFGRYMKMADILKVLWSPFRRRTLTLKPELPARLIDQGLSAPSRDAPQVNLPVISK